jgi:hypothetical protein
MVFVADTHCSTFIFLKDKKKIKELQADTQNKNPRQKNCLKLNNIMCVIVFLGKANTCGMQTQKKSYNYIMLNSQHQLLKVASRAQTKSNATQSKLES